MKKKKYIYFIFPALALIIFAAYYISFESGYEQREAEVQAKKKKARDDEIIAQNAAQKQAVEDAIKAQEKRKAEKKIKDELEAKKQDERQAAIQQRDKLQQDRATARDRVARLEGEVKQVTEDIKKTEDELGERVKQEAFLKQYVSQAEANQQRLSAVLTKISAADAAAAAAAKAAAAAAAAKK